MVSLAGMSVAYLSGGVTLARLCAMVAIVGFSIAIAALPRRRQWWRDGGETGCSRRS
ncbi:hypothetical protein ACWFPY_00585 [Nocardia fluminea]